MAADPIRLLLSDIDGTLITSQKVLTERTVAAVAQLRAAGIGFAVTSSRPPPGLGMFVAPLGITLPLGAFNGGLVCDPNLHPLERRSVPEAAVGPVIARIEASGLDVWVYRGDEWLVRDRAGAHVEHEAGVVQFTPTQIASFDDFTRGTAVDQVAKIVGVSDDPARVAAAEVAVAAEFGGQVSATRSQTYYLDVTHPQANKGAVVDYLSRTLRIPARAIATIGDGQNDTLMFARSGISIAMGNGSAEVRHAATHTTDTNDADGFAGAIEAFVLGSS